MRQLKSALMMIAASGAAATQAYAQAKSAPRPRAPAQTQAAGLSRTASPGSPRLAISSATAIGYSLPSSSVKVVVGLTLVRCAGSFAAQTDVTFVPIVSPSPHAEHRFSLDGRDLASFWKNRKIAIETFPNGTIKSLNGGLSDQTGSIISSIVRLAAGFVALDGEQAIRLADQCAPSTMSAVTRASSLTDRVTGLRAKLASLPPGEVVATKATIDVLAAEIARLRTNELRLELSSELVLDRGIRGATLRWRRNDFAKWLPADADAARINAPVADLAIGLCVAAEVPGATTPTCDGAAVDAADLAVRDEPNAPDPVSCPDDEGCRTTIVMREPRRATITAISRASGLAGRPSGSSLGTADLMVSQFGGISYLPLRIGFGKSVNFAMGFDENGHKVSQTWDATARGTTLLGAASSMADAAVGAYRAIDGERVAEQKAEIDRLNTLKAYNQAKYCEAVFAAGGFTCP